MNLINVKAERDYIVTISAEWRDRLEPLCQNRERVAVICSKGFMPDLSVVEKFECDLHIFVIPDGEAGKNFETLIKLWDWLAAAGFTRSDLVVGIGGGAVTDVAGFAAATWLRGIDWVAIPTSLAGMVDAAIGGKTGINCDYGKNLIGAFYSPIAVIIDPVWLESLSDRDFAAGLAEIIKCGFIKDTQILDLLLSQDLESLRSNDELVLELITRAALVKIEVVSADFKESFLREILNYGHTLGHAIEIQSKYQLRHGEAISIGLVYAAELACARKLISGSELELHRKLLKNFNLPTSYDRQSWQYLRPLLDLDKKSRGSQLRFIALDGLGSTVRLEDLTSAELDSAYERIST